MAEYIDMLPSPEDHPLEYNDYYNMILHYITALKCYIVVKDLQDRNMGGRFLNLLVFLATIIWVFPNTLRYSLRIFVDFGVILSYSYVQTLYNLHGGVVFLVYDLVYFIGSIAYSDIRTAVDIYLVLVLLHNYLIDEAIDGYKLTISLIGIHTVCFFSLLLCQYMCNIYDMVVFFTDTEIQFSSRVFYYSFMTIPISKQAIVHDILFSNNSEHATFEK